ncbi:MAG: cysteine desulfurase family protein [Thaumarchaeota archaeon]|nr:cysteine desulfurase family protein [Nitrososphaerota archaeon]
MTVVINQNNDKSTTQNLLSSDLNNFKTCENRSSDTDFTKNTLSKITYLDFNSTTPVEPRVVNDTILLHNIWFGNPSSEYSVYGKDANFRLEHARYHVAHLTGMSAPDVIFTSGATESNNMTLRGIAENSAKKASVLVGATEHKSVLETAKRLEDLDLAKVAIVPVDSNGIISSESLEVTIDEHGADIVSIMAANSETGVIHPTRELAKIAHVAGALFHCDATQALGRIPFDATEMGVDMVSLSGHKMYGPKGVGALVANRRARKALRAVTLGGGQEGGLRSGTPNVPGIVGLGKACEIAATEGIADGPRQAGLRDRLERLLADGLPGVTVNGAGAPRLPNTSSVRFEGAMSYATIANAPAVAISSGSACSSSTIEPSHVLLAMGLSDTEADETVRISLGRPTTTGDIERAAEHIIAAVRRVRGLEGTGPQAMEAATP